ncbi:Fe-S cluster assembly protein SufD [Flammeovirgaceae bacterium KN852]|uniref:Fe-S cluster assembly protein SufD n=2 Tax=Marinigracilibium pacificum TaxID=2729599 RepID=A0A848J133_9BACT|nr:Fe-S cluster assembly protein SufD [Marinigracilibium pacificum]
MPELYNKEGLKARFENWEKQLNGEKSSDFHSFRKESFDSYLKVGTPSRKNEEYKYTGLDKVIDKNFVEDDWNRTANVPEQTIKDRVIQDLEAYDIFFVNGILNKELSHWDELSKEINLMTIKEAFAAGEKECIDNFGKHATPDSDPFTAINDSLTDEGIFINIKKGQILTKPVMIYYLNYTNEGGVITHPHNLFIFGENSQGEIIEKFDTIGENHSLTNIVSEIVVNKSAVVKYYKIQSEHNGNVHVGNTQVWQDEHSNFTSTTLSFGGMMVRNNLNIALDASHCEANMYGLSLLKDNHHVDHHTSVDHRMPHAESNELYKGVFDEKSTGVFNGKIFVRQDAQKTNAFQSNRNVLLSKDATINTKPQLEIWADDVKCSHGATTGQIDPEQLFYLRSRGMDKQSARALLLYAFAMDIVEHIGNEQVRKYLDNLISERLQKNF